MRGPFQRFASSTLPFWLLAAAALALFAAIRAHRLPLAELRGDEATYVAMAASLARDGDLAFAAPDRRWAEARGGAALILERTARGVHYSKPVLYPLLAAPFLAIAGEAGLIAFNLLVLGLALLLARALLVRVAAGARVTEALLTFACASALVPYLVWRMAETLQVALALAGLSLALAAERGASGPAQGAVARLLAARHAPLTGALLLGLLIGLREPHAAVAAVPVLAALGGRRWRRAAAAAAAVAAGYLLVLGLTWATTGALNPYKAERATFNAATGYPAGEDAARALARFGTDEAWATSMLDVRPVWQGERTAYAVLYFFVGRHSGLIAYFPAALLLGALALGARDRVAWAGLAGFAGLAAFYLVWWPANYFGGETFVGNRYLLAAYPCLLLALPRLPSRRALAAVWGVAAIAGASALASVVRAGELDPTSQSHAHAGLFRLLPYESSASNIDGRRDRYWSGDFVRFVDPYARADEWSFELAAGDPAAEIELATVWEGDPTTWLVTCDAPRATLVVSDWRRTRRFPLTAHGAGSGGPVEVDLAPAWRVHPFWWSDGRPARARLVRFALEVPGGGFASARLRYLGRRRLPTGFAREVEAVTLPEEIPVPLEAAPRVRLRVRNGGDWTWRSDDALPVQAGVRWLPFDASARPVEMRVPLPRPVAPGEQLELEVPLTPPAAGTYRVLVDLVLEDVAWFGDRVGEPLAEGRIEVRLRTTSESAGPATASEAPR